MDMHTTPRAQDDIYGKVVHRTLYNYDFGQGRAGSRTRQVRRGLQRRPDPHLQAARRRLLPQRQKMTADDVIYSFTRIMDGKRSLLGGALGPRHQGRGRGREGPGDGDLGPEEDRRLHARDDADRHASIPGIYFYNGNTAIYPAGEADKPEFLQKPIGLGPFKFVEHVPGSRLVAERWEKFYKPGMPYADSVVIAIMGEAPARDIAFRNKEIDLSVLGPAQYVAYREDPNLKNGILEVAEVFTRHMGMNPDFKPFADKRVRQAINHAIDTDLIIKRLVKDKAYRAVSWLPLTSPAYDKDPQALRLRSREGEEAARRSRLSRMASSSNGPPARTKAGACRSSRRSIPMLARVGIKVKVKQVEVTVLVDLAARANSRPIICSNASGPDALAR